jgi:hypothetical protein
MARFGNREDDRPASGPSFGDRRNQREDQRRGSRPSAASARAGAPSTTSPRSATPRTADDAQGSVSRSPFINRSSASATTPPGVPQGTPFRQAAEDAAYSPSRRPSGQDSAPSTRSQESGRTPPRSSRPRDNSSRFDD